MTINYCKMSETLAVGPIYLAISATVHLQGSHNALPDHQFQVMVFYTLNLMAPLFKWYLCLPRHGFTAKSINSWGTQAQSWCQSIDQASHICIRLCRSQVLMRWSPRNPSSIWSCGGHRWEWLSQGIPPSPSQKGDHLVILIRISIPCWVFPWHGWRASWGAFSSQSAISLQRSSQSWCNSWSVRSPTSAWRWHGVPPSGWGLPAGKWGSPSPS